MIYKNISSRNTLSCAMSVIRIGLQLILTVKWPHTMLCWLCTYRKGWQSREGQKMINKVASTLPRPNYRKQS